MTEAGRRTLAALLSDQPPDCVVLVHGPSDVTWIERHESLARVAHEGAARVVSAHPLVLVSTDNVFDGSQPNRSVADPANPVNAYGRVKLAAENAARRGAVWTIARMSLVYGWSHPSRRPTYAEHCLTSARSAQPIAAPVDQYFTPLLVDDASAVLEGVVRSRGGGQLLHIAGPFRLSRYEFARMAYTAAGADPELVKPVRRAATEWACRPRHSSLRSDLGTVMPRSKWRPMPPWEGLRTMLRTRPAFSCGERS